MPALKIVSIAPQLLKKMVVSSKENVTNNFMIDDFSVQLEIQVSYQRRKKFYAKLT